MTLAQIIETILIRVNPSTTENGKQVYRYEIEALIPGALVRMYNRLKDSGKASELLTTETTNCVSGVITPTSTIITSSLEAQGDGYIFFADQEENQKQALSYEPILENKYLVRANPDLYLYSLAPYSSGTKIHVYKGDGLATAPDGTVSMLVTALYLPTSANVSTLNVEATETLIQSVIEILRERDNRDPIPSYMPTNIPTRVRSNPAGQ